jgi:hypothetical protein
MKRTIIVSVLIVGILALNSPSFGYGWAHHRHHYGHGWGYYNGWEAGAVIGGSILLGTLFSLALTDSYRYSAPPRTVYVYPEPVRQPYASPDPAFLERYSKSQETEKFPGPVYSSGENVGNPPGSWITVPGQWVKDNWVPPHQVWVPENQ